MADVNQRVNELENEIKVLKNEIKAILLDVREQYLNVENPFNFQAQGGGGGMPPINIASTTAGGQPAPTQVITNPTVETSLPVSRASVSDGATNDIGPVPAADGIVDNDTNPHPATDTESTTNDKTDSPDVKETKNAKSESNQETGKRAGKKGTLPSLDFEHEEAGKPPAQGEGKQRKKGNNLPSPSLQPDDQNDDDDSFQETEEQTWKDTRRGERQRYNSNYNKWNNSKINLITIAGLSKWVDESTEKIGKERTEVMVEACHMVGHINHELKELLIKLVRLAQSDEPKKGKINTKDYLGVIAQLENLLGYNNESEAALFSILTNSKDTSHG